MPNKRLLGRGVFLAFLLLLIVWFNGCEEAPDRVIFPSPEGFVAYFSPQDPLYPHLTYLIGEAKESIYAAFYKIELKELSRALFRAHQRGVKVKIFTDDLTSQDKRSEYDYLAKFGLIKRDHDPDSFMHHKFCVIDEKIVWTGSFNPTESGAHRENNNIVVIKSSPVAANFIQEFKRLWQGKLSSSKLSFSPLKLDESLIETYFSPQDNLEEAVIRVLKKAKKSIDFALFSFTSEKIAQVLVHKYAENLEVRGIMEKDQDGPFSQYQSLRRLRMRIIWDRNFYFMHHKFFVVDDSLVITGSFNPTWHATYQNRENLVIIHSPSLAKLYRTEFDRLWKGWH
ncbi:MAG: phosphatidylserine/phosphatidylglycerophosphate/cardiolipin synthase family protein [bacterium]